MNISGPAAVAKPEMLFYAPGDLTVTRIPTPLQMALKQKPGGKIAARFVCCLGGSPFLYPLEPYR